MTKITVENENWVDKDGNIVGKIIQTSPRNFAIQTPSGERKPIKLGRVDEKNKFYELCQNPFTTCIKPCKKYATGCCRFNPIMDEIGYYMFD